MTVVNNGPRKGGEPGSFRALKATPSIQAIYQVHRNVRVGDDLNTEALQTANPAEACEGQPGQALGRFRPARATPSRSPRPNTSGPSPPARPWPPPPEPPHQRRHDRRPALGHNERALDLTLTPEQTLIRDTARDLANKEIAPRAAEIDASTATPRELVKRHGRARLPRHRRPRGVRRRRARHVSYALAMEEICARLRVDRRHHVGQQLAGLRSDLPVRHRGAEAGVPRRRSPPGKKLGCFALSEPEAGSDAAAQKTTAAPRRRRLGAQRHQELDHQRPGRRRRACCSR